MNPPAQLTLRWEALTNDLLKEGKRFPVYLRFSLTRSLHRCLIEGVMTLATLEYSSSELKLTRLQQLDETLAQIRALIRLAHSQQALSHARYEAHQRTVDELGRMIGGWRRYLRRV